MLFNHESERRGENFVTRKITRAAGRIKMGLQEKLYLGNLDAKRDWGHARDYVEAMWLMLQQDTADDYVIASGEAYSVRDFLTRVFTLLSLDWQDYVEIDPYYFRPTEVDFLLGDASKARSKIGWKPKISFDELTKMMTEHDLELAEREVHALSFSGAGKTKGGSKATLILEDKQMSSSAKSTKSKWSVGNCETTKF